MHLHLHIEDCKDSTKTSSVGRVRNMIYAHIHWTSSCMDIVHVMGAAQRGHIVGGVKTGPTSLRHLHLDENGMWNHGNLLRLYEWSRWSLDSTAFFLETKGAVSNMFAISIVLSLQSGCRSLWSWELPGKTYVEAQFISNFKYLGKYHISRLTIWVNYRDITWTGTS